MMETVPLAAPVLEYANDSALLARVLMPYRLHCRYLKMSNIKVHGEPRDGGRISAVCALGIPESCYIDDTGHFNSVEFNICYNQMLYYVMAKAVKERFMNPFARWSLDDYWARQLPDVLITDFRSAFKRAMRGRNFSGEIDILNVSEWDGNDLRGPLVTIVSTCRFWDAHGGYSHGEVKIAVTNPPALLAA